MFMYIVIALIGAFSGGYLLSCLTTNSNDWIYGFLIGIVFSIPIILIYDIERNKKKLSQYRSIQKEVVSEKKLKFYYHNKVMIPSVIILCLVYILTFGQILNMFFLLIYVLIFAMVYCIKDDILFYKDTIDYKYGIIDVENESFIPAEVEKQLNSKGDDTLNIFEEEMKKYNKFKRRLAILSCVHNENSYVDLIEEPHISTLEFKRGRNDISVGSFWFTIIRKRRRTAYTRESAFISFKMPIAIKHKIELEKGGSRNTIESIGDDDILIPLYKNIPLMVCDNKMYAEKIMNEEIQEILANLVSKINGKYIIKFFDDTILIVIFDAKWSTNFSRMFLKKKSAQNICDIIDEVTELLGAIASKIENERLYE